MQIQTSTVLRAKQDSDIKQSHLFCVLSLKLWTNLSFFLKVFILLKENFCAYLRVITRDQF